MLVAMIIQRTEARDEKVRAGNVLILKHLLNSNRESLYDFFLQKFGLLRFGFCPTHSSAFWLEIITVYCRTGNT